MGDGQRDGRGTEGQGEEGVRWAGRGGRENAGEEAAQG